MYARRCSIVCLALVLGACGAEGSRDPPVLVTTSATAVTPEASATSQPPTPSATSQPPTTIPPVAALGAGLFCRDLAAQGYGYSDAVAYWTREGSPDRMDADRNAIPCETVYDAGEVLAFWGDPLPTTTIIDTWYAVDAPAYQVAPLPGSGGLYDSGCSPGPGPLPDGIWFGSIKVATTDAVQFDLMCFGPGPEGPGDVSNSSDTLRTVPVLGGAIIFLFDHSSGWDSRTYWGWMTDPADAGSCPEGCLVWLYVNSGHVTEVVQLFFA